jgi:hypothetical protein
MKPGLDDWKAFRAAALEHEQIARLTGCEEHADFARRMWREATDRRLSALYPPQRCVECSAIVHSDETKCGRCGRARQGVRVNLPALAKFLADYDWTTLERLLASGQIALAPKPSPADRPLKAACGPSVKLTFALARDIRARRAGGETIASLATSHKMTPQAIRNVVRGKCWREGGASL